MVTFDEETHTYYDETTGKKLISTTQLLRKHGLSPDYGAVPQKVLEKKAERGSLIHAEMEAYVKRSEIGFTAELFNFMSYSSSNGFHFLESERMVNNDIVAGTLDLMYEKDGEVVLSDFKTTASLHKETVSWQLSIYAYLYEKEFNKKVDRLTVIWLKDEDSLEEIEMPRKSDELIEKLFDCERNGEIFKQDLQPFQNEVAILYDLEAIIKECEERKKKAEEQAKSIRDKLLTAMEENAMLSLETDNVKVTYVGESTRTTVDSSRLKEELPDVYEKYQKKSKIKPSLKITWKKK